MCCRWKMIFIQVEESKLSCFGAPLSKVVGNTPWVKIRHRKFLTPPRHSLCIPGGQYSLWRQQWKGPSICWSRVAGWRQRQSQPSLVTHPTSISPHAASMPGAASIGHQSRSWEWWHHGSLCCVMHPHTPEYRRVKWKLRPSCLFLLFRLSTPLKFSFSHWLWLIFPLAQLYCTNNLSSELLNTGFLNAKFCWPLLCPVSVF